MIGDLHSQINRETWEDTSFGTFSTQILYHGHVPQASFSPTDASTHSCPWELQSTPLAFWRNHCTSLSTVPSPRSCCAISCHRRLPWAGHPHVLFPLRCCWWWCPKLWEYETSAQRFMRRGALFHFSSRWGSFFWNLHGIIRRNSSISSRFCQNVWNFYCFWTEKLFMTRDMSLWPLENGITICTPRFPKLKPVYNNVAITIWPKATSNSCHATTTGISWTWKSLFRSTTAHVEEISR